MRTTPPHKRPVSPPSTDPVSATPSPSGSASPVPGLRIGAGAQHAARAGL
jgi:hypothetical protein